ncbi:hypothetical protein DNU06_06985 [Putridiphycobacter roseus]|uniref:Uncharacterized protein n=1 Tax=Putridiphycobacter roseus TaxID=2219161 RepID=A0A2W1N042_9FLAO|nr:hypothetical protein [Putridiphycobacter roseus]PZE17567.1 hypothetical protein DNU06_06985 [Putridiphycobacter roseus]
MEEIYVNREIREMLIELAVKNKTITYARLNTAADAGYNFQDPDERDSFNEDLEAISMSEIKAGRPPLSCVVVYKSGSVGKTILESLYAMCEAPFDLNPETDKPNTKFLKSLQARCHEYWIIADNYKKFGPKKY